MTLTRAEFNRAAQCFIRRQESAQFVNQFTARSTQGWHWLEHSVRVFSHLPAPWLKALCQTIQGIGYMFRTGSAFRRSRKPLVPGDEFAEDMQEDDQALLPSQTPPESLEPLPVHQHIVYSPTFQVPAFYFAIHDASASARPSGSIPVPTHARGGSPLPLEEIVETTLFHPQSGISVAPCNFPSISQGDHPVLGTPCWYFHPCETSAAVSELLGDTGEHGTTDDRLVHWMEAWFLVISSVVDLRM